MIDTKGDLDMDFFSLFILLHPIGQKNAAVVAHEIGRAHD
jgi:hypothetical protein